MIFPGNRVVPIRFGNILLLLIIFVLFSACNKLEPERKVKISSATIIDTTTTSCIVEGSILDMGENAVLQVGFCWATNNPPTINANISDAGLRQNTGSFGDTIYGLWSDTEYYIRPYARNADDVYYGEVKSFITHWSDRAQLEIAGLSNITMTSAQCGGKVTDDGGTFITARGVCWSTSENPTIFDNKTVDGMGVGSFVSTLTNLSPNTTYYVQVYATNEAGTNYGDKWKFKTMKSILTDDDGNEYYTVEIASNEWMASNLNVIHYRNGDPIPYVTGGEWMDRDSGAYCYYDNDPKTYEYTYGALYNWHVVNDIRGLCPEGWRVPEDSVWKNLINYLGNEHVAGLYLKEGGLDHWKSPNEGANNETGFSALPAGRRHFEGNYESITKRAFFWTRTYDEAPWSFFKSLDYNNGRMDPDQSGDFLFGMSVRCIKGEVPDTMSGTFTDVRDGREYDWLKIGRQRWMTENLAYLPGVNLETDSSFSLPNHYVYGYSGTDTEAARATTNYQEYGVLYNWAAAMAACPDGWHLPSEPEFTILEAFLGMSTIDIEAIDMRGTDEGSQLKEVGFEHWESFNTDATNESGFTALPGGHCGSGAFQNLGTEANFWTTREHSIDRAWRRTLKSGEGGIARNHVQKADGYSVRCVQD